MARNSSASDPSSTVIVVGDPHTPDPDGLDRALAAYGATAHRTAEARAILTRRRDDVGLAIVSVAEGPAFGAAAFDDVAHLKRLGFTVICYGSGVSEWPLGAQCRLLLAGAVQILDSRQPTFADDFCDRVRELIGSERERRREHRRILDQMDALGVVGSSPEIIEVFRWILNVSVVSDLPVLIVGETGTGKEVAARAIHQLDARRRRGPFVPVNCSAISAGLAESELFGHLRGAFTGAVRDREGLVRAARGGILFLDEIGDLDLTLQGKLLRVLQERRVLALGEDREVPVDVRVIAATNRDLGPMVQRQEFRADLFHRLNVFSVRIPALRDRPDDIEPLIRHFVARHGPATCDHAVLIGRDLVQALRRVTLPGNVRQLEHVIQRALVMSKQGEPLRLSSLPPEIWMELARVESGAPVASTPTSDDPTGKIDAMAVLEESSWKLGRALDLCEEKLVAAALGKADGNRSRAARLLGISPRSIFNKIRKHRFTA